jgi:hypothetical protein
LSGQRRPGAHAWKGWARSEKRLGRPVDFRQGRRQEVTGRGREVSGHGCVVAEGKDRSSNNVAPGWASGSGKDQLTHQIRAGRSSRRKYLMSRGDPEPLPGAPPEDAGAGAHSYRFMKRLTAATGSVPQPRAQSQNSATSTRRFPVSQL